MKRLRIRKLEPLLYLLPALTFFVLFTYYPFAKTVGSSFFLVNSIGQAREWVGWEHYARILRDPVFLSSIKNTITYAVVSVPTSIVLALLLALIANKKTKASPIYETMFALTMAMSTSVCAMIFKLMYNPSLGILNEILGTNIRWLKDSRWTLYSISFISIWMNIGFNFLFLLAAVRGVPIELLECAETEGAGSIKRSIHIILPIISPTIFFLVINALARAMMMSGLVIILTDGGRAGSASTMISYMYSQSFLAENYNNGFAAATVAFVLTFGLLLISFLFENKVNYD